MRPVFKHQPVPPDVQDIPNSSTTSLQEVGLSEREMLVVNIAKPP